MTERTKEEWVAALRGDLGDSAQAEAYVDLSKYLYKVSCNFLYASREKFSTSHLDDLAGLAEEFTQDVLEKTARDALYSRYRGEGKFTSFMAMIVINEIRQELRRKKWSVPVMALSSSNEVDGYADDTCWQLPSTDLGPDARAELTEILEIIRGCLATLPEHWQRAFMWSVTDGLTATAIKDRLSAQSEQAVYNLINRARSRLKKCVFDQNKNWDEIWRLFK